MRQAPLVTSPDAEAWRWAFCVAYYERTGKVASDAAASVCWAQWALETGRGAHCMNNNLGNIMPGAGWQGDIVALPTWELVKGKRENVIEDFRSYTSFLAGMRDYLTFLSRPSYAKAWAAIEAGDAGLFAHILHLLGYYTALESDYVRGLLSLAHEFLVKSKVLEGVKGIIQFTSAEIAEHDAAESDALQSLPLASFDPMTLADTHTVRSTAHDILCEAA